MALQAAMVSMLREGSTVSEWAAFVVYGLASAQLAEEIGDEEDDELAAALKLSLETEG